MSEKETNTFLNKDLERVVHGTVSADLLKGVDSPESGEKLKTGLDALIKSVE